MPNDPLIPNQISRYVSVSAQKVISYQNLEKSDHHTPERWSVDRVSGLGSWNSSSSHCLRLFEAPASSDLTQTGKNKELSSNCDLTPGPGLCDWGTLDLPRKGFLERDCFWSGSEVSPPSSSSFFFPPIENLAHGHKTEVSFKKAPCHLPQGWSQHTASASRTLLPWWRIASSRFALSFGSGGRI